MIIAVDIGNSLVKLALIGDDRTPKSRLSLETEVRKTPDEYISLILYSKFGRQLSELAPQGAILSSVVSPLTPVFALVLERLLKRPPLIVGPGIRSGVPLHVEHPLEVGSDLVSAASGAILRGRLPAFIADFGTANKYIFVSRDGAFEGVAIAPGLRSGATSLKERTSSLPEASLALPSSPLGKNTFDSLNAGLLYGVAHAARGFLKDYAELAKEPLTPYLTGGNARFVKPLLDEFTYEPDLLMEGLYRIYRKNEVE